MPPPRARAAHAAQLEHAIAVAVAAARQALAQRDDSIAEGERGFYLDFEVPMEHQVALDSLENRQKKIELVAVRASTVNEGMVQATVFVPEAQADYYAGKVEEYRDEETRTGKPKNEKLVARIETARLSALRSLFTDEPSLYPAGGERIWWEVWLRDGRLPAFRTVADRLAIEIKEQLVTFPERDVVLALADTDTLARLIANNDAIAELRIPRDTPSFFLDMAPREQADWARDLAARMTPPTALAPAVCLLDSGATRGHPVIAPGLEAGDQHACDPDWGVGDSAFWNGHGTLMAGVALLGDLEAALGTNAAVPLSHRLETVKILPPSAQNDPTLYGAIVEMGIRIVEQRAPRRARVFCMAVTSVNGHRRGRPSSWSAAVDKLCYGGGDQRRLLFVAAGNIREQIVPTTYPDNNDLAEAENPSQAWNAVVVGAYTNKTTIRHPDHVNWQTVAPAGDLSPVSRTSTTWDRQWAIRPDIVFEGGNLAHNGVSAADPIDDLQLVGTHYQPNVRLFSSFGDTSAATALASNFSARILAARPELWPETIRALLVHSAEWTPAMRARFDAASSQAQKMALLRRYGWGVPDLDRALRSASNDATLMIEDALLPFRRDKSDIKTRDMHLHELPWPRDELLALGNTDVELRVTLSYFIEPNPGERGWTRRHSYRSHALRFAVKRSLESVSQFRQRINRAAQAEDTGQGNAVSGSDEWVLGVLRDRGSVHSDIWRGSAAALAERDAICVFPLGGWWKEKPALQRWDRSTRYALIVSIRAPEAEVDLYTAIENQLVVPVSAR